MVICKNCRKNEVSYDSPGESEGLCKECYDNKRKKELELEREREASLIRAVQDAVHSVEVPCFSLNEMKKQAKTKKEVERELPECGAREDKQRSGEDFGL